MFGLSSVFAIKEKILNCRSSEELKVNIAHMAGFCGFEYYLFGSLTPNDIHKPKVTIINGYPSEWRERYDELGYISNDPTVKFCSKNISPIAWPKLTLLSDDSSKIMTECKEYGLNFGISIPIHSSGSSWAMLSLSTNINYHDYRDLEQQLIFATNVLPYIYCSSLKILDHQSIPYPNLTDREKECLKWTADGKTSWEISKILNISERTVVFHLSNVCKRLSVSNRPQAVAKAISISIIDPIL